MRPLLLLFLVLPCLLGAQDSSSDLSVADLFQRFLDVEKALKEEWKNDYISFKKQQKEAKAAAEAQLNATISAVENEFKRKANEIKTAFEQIRAAKEAKKAEDDQRRQEVVDELRKAFDAISGIRREKKEEEKKQMDDLMNRMKAKWEERVQQGIEEKKREMEDFNNALNRIKQQWDEFKVQLQETKDAAAARKKEKEEEVQQSVEQLKQLMQEEKVRRDEAKRQRQEKFNETMDVYRQDIQEKKDELEAIENEVLSRFEEIKEKKAEIQDLIKGAMGEGMKAFMGEKIAEKLQNQLDKAAVFEVIKGRQSASATGVDTKATVLDEITGTSQWQTVTWILLALSILLTIALIAMIFYQVSQRKHYQLLEGTDDAERAPLAKGGAMNPSYTEAPTTSAPKSILSKPSATKSEPATAPEEEQAI